MERPDINLPDPWLSGPEDPMSDFAAFASCGLKSGNLCTISSLDSLFDWDAIYLENISEEAPAANNDNTSCIVQECVNTPNFRPSIQFIQPRMDPTVMVDGQSSASSPRDQPSPLGITLHRRSSRQPPEYMAPGCQVWKDGSRQLDSRPMYQYYNSNDGTPHPSPPGAIRPARLGRFRDYRSHPYHLPRNDAHGEARFSISTNQSRRINGHSPTPMHDFPVNEFHAAGLQLTPPFEGVKLSQPQFEAPKPIRPATADILRRALEKLDLDEESIETTSTNPDNLLRSVLGFLEKQSDATLLMREFVKSSLEDLEDSELFSLEKLRNNARAHNANVTDLNDLLLILPLRCPPAVQNANTFTFRSPAVGIGDEPISPKTSPGGYFLDDGGPFIPPAPLTGFQIKLASNDEITELLALYDVSYASHMFTPIKKELYLRFIGASRELMEKVLN